MRIAGRFSIDVARSQAVLATEVVTANRAVCSASPAGDVIVATDNQL
jgi:hypothetical protein